MRLRTRRRCGRFGSYWSGTSSGTSAPGSSVTAPATSTRPALTASRAARRERPNRCETAESSLTASSRRAVRGYPDLDEEVAIADAGTRRRARPEDGGGTKLLVEKATEALEVVAPERGRAVADGEHVHEHD